MADMVEQQLRQLGEYLESETGVSLRSGEPVAEPRPFDGKAPSFFRDPTFLLVGPAWYAKRLFARAIGRPDPAEIA